MRIRALGLVAALGLVVLVAACSDPSNNDTAPSAGLPAVRIPVGPVPGPHIAGPPAIKNPYENDPVARQDGRRLFLEMNCYGCHGGHAGGGMGPSLRDPAWIYGKAPQEVFSSIAEGRANGMPAWGTKLSDDQIWKLVAYVESLETPDEADPPTQPTIPQGMGWQQ